MISLRLAVFLLALLSALPATTLADDWPQWRGPQRDGVWRESDLVKSLPEGPLKFLWRVPCDLGYAGPAVADGKVYLYEYERSSGTITNNPGGRDKLEGVERLRCLDEATGEELWRYEYDRPYFVSYPAGPRATPTVDGDRVYLLGTEGNLVCLKTEDGSIVWKKSYADDYSAETPLWGHSAHPLVDGDTLYCLVGGEGTLAVAFNKLNGEEIWRSMTTYDVGYCPPSMIEHNGSKQLLIFHPEAINGVQPTSGEVLWSVPIKPEYGMSIAQPLLIGNRLFTTGYGGVSVMIELPVAGGEARVLWAGKPKTSLSAANASPIASPDGQVIFGCDANSSSLIAVDATTGERLWETQEPTLGDKGRARHGTAFIVRQGDTDRYWLASETGDLILAQLTAQGYEELGRKPLVAPVGETFGRSIVWSHPAFANGHVYARNDQEIVCVDLNAE